MSVGFLLTNETQRNIPPGLEILDGTFCTNFLLGTINRPKPHDTAIKTKFQPIGRQTDSTDKKSVPIMYRSIAPLQFGQLKKTTKKTDV